MLFPREQSFSLWHKTRSCLGRWKDFFFLFPWLLSGVASSVLLYVVPFLCANWNEKVWLKLFDFKSIQAPFRSSIPKMSIPRGVCIPGFPSVFERQSEFHTQEYGPYLYKLSTNATFPSVTQMHCPLMRNSPREDTWRVSFQQLWHRKCFILNLSRIWLIFLPRPLLFSTYPENTPPTTLRTDSPWSPTCSLTNRKGKECFSITST